ncbi:hypothetical protein [Acidisphaera sp. L21]|uniref:hypothetical protein n=1 Tax=Acidisphaera sp. L21 TaxID=1641851 RepID=UPI00131DABD0|nr:hypothetical protein [Acidisphaera sp. L21]
MADRQRNRVYAWEDRVVAPHDPTVVPFGAGQGMVNAIWAEMGLLYPPRVEPLPAQARCRIADANRLRIRLPRSTPSWCVLHELAHAMTTTQDGVSDGHGADFVGVYVQLLRTYLRLDGAELQASLAQAGVKVRMEARAVFSD